MELSNDLVILRDYEETDIDNHIRWWTLETEWQLWDAPWENDLSEKFDPESYREKRLAQLAKREDENRIRRSFQISINNRERKHIGWCNAYLIDNYYRYSEGVGKWTLGISIPDLASRRKGYASAAWTLYIQYLLGQGIKEIYTQTWSGNERVIGLMKKLGFSLCNEKPKNVKVRGKYYSSLTFQLEVKNFIINTS